MEWAMYSPSPRPDRVGVAEAPRWNGLKIVCSVSAGISAPVLLTASATQPSRARIRSRMTPSGAECCSAWPRGWTRSAPRAPVPGDPQLGGRVDFNRAAVVREQDLVHHLPDEPRGIAGHLVDRETAEIAPDGIEHRSDDLIHPGGAPGDAARDRPVLGRQIVAPQQDGRSGDDGAERIPQIVAEDGDEPMAEQDGLLGIVQRLATGRVTFFGSS